MLLLPLFGLAPRLLEGSGINIGEACERAVICCGDEMMYFSSHEILILFLLFTKSEAVQKLHEICQMFLRT